MCLNQLFKASGVFQIEDAVAKKDKKYNIMAILSNSNALLITLLCSFLWSVLFFFTNAF